ncbi:PIN domain-containing protein [Candidatus Aerophobetes bacterium]|uniref:PIN domain-containing protein n=1 Tax=Aerophobetes bacterium TaxID=2030807 RepID=A0A523RRX9_UNCAE|nr:MAG: PIN domain-containing protein [Candidatus Aerophobetes bacterium]
MIFIDTNIIMYAVGRPHKYKSSCAKIIMGISEGKIPGVIDCEVLQELLYRYWHIGELEKGLEVFECFQSLIPKILEINRSDLVTAAQILKENSLISPRDAIHIAVMKNNKINLICTTDSHFDKIEGIERKDPLAY